MFLDEELPRKKDAPTPRDLTRLSIEELQEYIAWLKGEIVRCEEDIARKKKIAQDAEKFFKPSGG